MAYDSVCIFFTVIVMEMPLKVLYQHAIYINSFFEILSPSKQAAKKEVLNINSSWALSRWFITDIWVNPMYN